MNSVVFTKSEIEAAMLISRNEILSNHCIDDMIIAEYMKNYSENLNSKEFKEYTKSVGKIWKGKDKDNVYFSLSLKQIKNYFN